MSERQKSRRFRLGCRPSVRAVFTAMSPAAVFIAAFAAFLFLGLPALADEIEPEPEPALEPEPQPEPVTAPKAAPAPEAA